MSPNSGIYFEKLTTKTTNLVKFPDSNSDRVIAEIKLFWDSKDKFAKFKMPYKRGVLLWGPPGSGKSCTVQFVMADVVARGGMVINFSHPELFLKGYRILREVQPDTPVIVIMEDVDATLDDWSESSVLNILDGAVDEVENVVFLATTNYPEKLGARVINRPSRFDRRFKIGFPTPEARKTYFEHLFKKHDLAESKQLDQWVKDTEGMSIAHLRELFVAVIILDNDYQESIEILKMMDMDISSSQDGGGKVGFL
jgi:SpoVK/Ycf46/Vps4 family AAA+-type ATPase